MANNIIKLKTVSNKTTMVKIKINDSDRFYNNYNEYYTWTINGTASINGKEYDFIYDDENGNQGNFDNMFTEEKEERLWKRIKSLGIKFYKKTI